MKSRASQLTIHILGCAIYITALLVLSPERKSLLDLFTRSGGQLFITDKLLVLAFFYLNYFVLIPKFFFKKRYAIYLSLVALSLLAIILLPDMLIRSCQNINDLSHGVSEVKRFKPNKSIFGRYSFRISQNLFLFLSALFLSLVIKISNRWKQAEQQKLSVELSYLKAQINPHFLFNTLNSIYSLALEKSEAAPMAVVKLSDMMRYIIHDANHDFVPLDKEIKYITDYIELQKLRFGNSVDLQYAVTGNVFGKKIAPLILIAFIENAFKYGVNAEENSKINIAINIEKDELHLSVENNKVHHASTDASNGLGIENAKNRLNLLYPSNHNLIINNNLHNFSVLLTINLK
ncbi:sensor histidine kinase [Solitalea lacus]|uniref:sensor histidine kinase n=1 Tax=Solitalea lacus TaxID=2911172 RepID=UPI001EDB49BF|nr:sensor histidine kinase [Solitalea lacus]UKJ06503.1 sensor histidine kinase [Solitalea lacus]